MEAYTTLTGISKLNDMVIEGQNQSATFRISIIPTYANRYDPFTVQSLNPDIASVRDSGADTYTVTSVGLGTTQISVTNGPISEQFDVTVQRANIAVKKITLSEQNKSMIADDEFTLTATVEPTDATEEIDWSVTPSDLLAVSYPNNKTANMSVTISGEECLGINQTASKAIWRIDGVAQSGRTGTVDCDNELHNIQFNGG